MLRKLKIAAQSTAEYAIIIAIVVGAVVAMQIYVKRGIQGRVKEVVDFKGKSTDTAARNLFTTDQYEPYYSESNMTTQSDAQRQEQMQTGGAINRAIVGQERTQRTGTQVTRDINAQD